MSINNFLLRQKYFFILFFILLLGFMLRIYNLPEIPKGFFCDEASIGYNAYLILTTGKDEYGISLPFFYKAFGEFKNPIQMYATIPFVFVFGLREFSVRLISVFFGISGILALFFMTRQLFHTEANKNTLALLAAFFLAISPWHIHFSRVSLEGLAAFVFFTCIGIFSFLKAQRKFSHLYASTIFFCLAFYSYFPARIFIPFFVLSLCLLYIKNFLIHKKIVVINIILLFFLLSPFLNSLLSESALQRWQQVSIFSQPPKDQSIFMHISKNYVSHFSYDFLFSKGDVGMPGQFITRHSVQGIGELYFFQLFLFPFGFLFLLKKRFRKTFWIIFMWIILYPTGSMFTIDANAQATRSIIGVIPFQIILAAGLMYLFTLLRFRVIKITIFIVISCVIFLSVQTYMHKYFVQYPKNSANFWGWQYGPREVISYFVAKEKMYDEFYMIGEFNAPEIFFKFYAPHNCQNCKIGVPLTNYDTNKKQLFAVTPSYLAVNKTPWKTKKIIYYPDNTIAFYIGEVVR